MSNRLFQGIIHQMSEAIDRTIGVIDESSIIIACSDLSRVGDIFEEAALDAMAAEDVFIAEECTFKPFGPRQSPSYAAFVSGADPDARRYVRILGIAMDNIKAYYDEKYDRSNFIKNVILDNILPGDIYIKSHELHFEPEVQRVCLLIKVGDKNEISSFEILQNLFPDKAKDFIININETDIALVKEMARSFKGAQTALEVGKVFDTARDIVSYNNLGIARLIYQLPTTLCEMFLKEIFKVGSIETLDHETLFTIQRFFENNLNVSETSRKLFVHRNTLVYRLEKIRKLTGLDLREFEDAIVFKVALMVKKYLDNNAASKY